MNRSTLLLSLIALCVCIGLSNIATYVTYEEPEVVNHYILMHGTPDLPVDRAEPVSLPVRMMDI